MTFTKVWKEQIVKPQTRLGIWKPKEELQPREEEDKDCCEEARIKFTKMYGEDIPKITLITLTNWKCEELRKYLEGFIANNRSASGYYTNPGTMPWLDSQQEILDEWDRCEGR